MEDSQISVIEALNHVQSWLNAGEYDKVIQGCQEILQIEPGNQRALALMKQAEEKRHETQVPTAQESPVAPTFDPLAKLQVEKTPEEAMNVQSANDERSEKRKLFLAMMIPAIIVVIVGGAAIWWLANRDREQVIQDGITPDVIDDTSYLDENDQRLTDLTIMATVLEKYKIANGTYPSVDQLQSALVKDETIEKVPVDPKQGELDKAGKPFGYVYAVYSGMGGENSVYVLSGLFEDSKGFGYAWTQGAPIRNYPDYRDYREENITFVGGDEDAVTEAIENGGKAADSEDSGDGTADGADNGPKVNPNY